MNLLELPLPLQPPGWDPKSPVSEAVSLWIDQGRPDKADLARCWQDLSRNRGTGRTSRDVIHCLLTAYFGEVNWVYVAANHNFAEMLYRNSLRWLPALDIPRQYVEPINSQLRLTFEVGNFVVFTSSMCDPDWLTRGARPKPKLWYDHYQPPRR